MKIVLTCLAVILVMSCLSACIHSARYTSRTEKAHPPSGDFVVTDIARIHVIERGLKDGPAVLMIHGASANAEEFTHTLAPRLSDTHHLLMVDRPGHGYSSRPDKSNTLGVQASLMADVLTERAPGKKAIIVGHSFGGAVALRLALDRPDLVAGLVLLAPATHDWGGGSEAWYNATAARPVIGRLFSQLAPIAGPRQIENGIVGVFHPDPAPENYAEASAIPLLFRPSEFRANARDVRNLRRELAAQQDRYAELTLPIALYSGLRDTVLKPELHAGRLIQQVPHMQLIELPNGGHMPHHAQSEAIADTIRTLAITPVTE